MNDVRNILGMDSRQPSTRDDLDELLGEKKRTQSRRAKIPENMSREVFGLLAHDSASSIVPGISTEDTFSKKRKEARTGQWFLRNLMILNL